MYFCTIPSLAHLMTKLLFLFVLFTQLAWAQFNDSTFYHLGYSGLGIINKTNDANSYNLNNGLRFNVNKKKISINITNSWIYGRQQTLLEDKLTNNDFSSILDFDFLKSTQTIYYWGLASFDKSFSLKINDREQAGLGIGYHLVKRDNMAFTLSDGLLYERNDLYDAEAKELIRNSFRIKFRYSFRHFISLDGTDYIQHSLADPNDYIIKSVTNFSFKLHKLLSFTTSATYNKLNITGKENLLINFGLTLEKYF